MSDFQPFTETKIHKFYVIVLVKQYVFRLQIAIDNTSIMQEILKEKQIDEYNSTINRSASFMDLPIAIAISETYNCTSLCVNLTIRLKSSPPEMYSVTKKKFKLGLIKYFQILLFLSCL